MYDVSSLRAVDCEANDTFLEKSAIPQKNAEQEVFARRPIVAVKIVGYCYRSLLYSDLGGQRQLKNAYGEIVIALNVEKFSK